MSSQNHRSHRSLRFAVAVALTCLLTAAPAVAADHESTPAHLSSETSLLESLYQAVWTALEDLFTKAVDPWDDDLEPPPPPPPSALPTLP